MEKSLKWQLTISRFLFALFMASVVAFTQTVVYQAFIMYALFFSWFTHPVWLAITAILAMELANLIIFRRKKGEVSFAHLLNIYKEGILDIFPNYFNEHGRLGMVKSLNVILFLLCTFFLLGPFGRIMWYFGGLSYLFFIAAYEVWRDPLGIKDYARMVDQETLTPTK